MHKCRYAIIYSPLTICIIFHSYLFHLVHIFTSNPNISPLTYIIVAISLLTAHVPFWFVQTHTSSCTSLFTLLRHLNMHLLVPNTQTDMQVYAAHSISFDHLPINIITHCLSLFLHSITSYPFTMHSRGRRQTPPPHVPTPVCNMQMLLREEQQEGKHLCLHLCGDVSIPKQSPNYCILPFLGVQSKIIIPV